ncbi:hypothetical protein AB833_23050 [Chromatiales bacterium (ex Bugula neritina AB1)]|nr:hypothetical protein AB833_23050 [Chromatiales bacterium (ex Bugula neritina AB1)]
MQAPGEVFLTDISKEGREVTDYTVEDQGQAPRGVIELKRYGMEFHGRGGEYFKIWVVNILLSVVTLYIYSAWAKVRTRRYFYGNTLLDKSAFGYHATGKQLVLGRLIGLVLFVIVVMAESLGPRIVGVVYLLLLLLAPWAIWRSTLFNARVSSYRNIRFGFNGGLGKFYWYLLVLPFLPLVLMAVCAGLLYVSGLLPTADTLLFFIAVPVVAGFALMYLLAPYVHCKLSQFTVDHYRYGKADFDTQLKPGRYYLITLKSLGILLFIWGLLLATGYVITLIDSSWLDVDSLFVKDGEPGLSFYLAMGIGYVVFLVTIYLAIAFYQARVRNYLFQRTLLAKEVQVDSSVGARGLLWLTLSNTLLIVFTLGLGYPWAAVRKARYFATNTSVWTAHSLTGFVADQQRQVSAMGEEIGDALDMDLDIGI